MLIESAQILLRRRVWVSFALVAALVAGLAAYSAIKPTQETDAIVLFVPSASQPGTAGLTNPFNSLGGSTVTMTSVVEVVVGDDSTTARLKANGYRAKYVVEPNLAPNAGPSLLVKATDTSAAVAEKTLQGVLKELKAQLREIQIRQKVPTRYLIGSIVLTQSPHAVASHKSQIQSAVVAFVLVLFLLLVSILIWDRRRPGGLDASGDSDLKPNGPAPSGAPSARPGSDLSERRLVRPSDAKRRAGRPNSLTRRRGNRDDRPKQPRGRGSASPGRTIRRS